MHAIAAKAAAAATTRGFGAYEFRAVGEMIVEVINRDVGARVLALCTRFPIYR